MNKKAITVVIILFLLLCGAFATILYNFYKQKEEMAEMVELVDYEKEMLEQEYEEISQEYKETTFKISNDSIAKLLVEEQQKVQMLLEELRTTKSTNARRIAELKKELASVRKVMQHYVAQIDSLSKENKILITENKEVKQKYEQATEDIRILSEEKELLNEQVERASMLDARNINLETLNSNGKVVSKLKRASLLKVSFLIAKNITTNPGMKKAYVCIIGPDNKILTKSDSDLFTFENKELNYSMVKEYEYEGEDININLFWNIDNYLAPGIYQVNIFSDGNLIGSKDFNLL